MGFQQSPRTADAVQPLWKQYRGEFPVTERLVYLNHAAVAPLPRCSAAAMQALAADSLNFGSLHYDEWLDTYEALRKAAARLIGADRGEIAIVKNTSEGIATVALGLDWRPGDTIVAFSEEFPANVYPWKRLEAHRCYVKWLSIHDSLEVIEEACHGAKLLAISFVQYLSGFRADLNTIGRICKQHGVFFLVDAIQGLGAFPLDVRAAGIDALAADGHKWMLGPEGCGILFVRRDRQDSVVPAEFGWTNVAGYNDYASRDMTLRSDAGRYECGTLNTIGCFGLRASLEFLLSVGVDNIGPAVQALADQLAEGAQRKGYSVLGARTPDTASGIVTIQKIGVDSRLVVRELKSKGIIAAPRQGWVRLSPHFYISPEEIERVVHALP
ncbi:MAG TPA: aminotransferase class V-fold PLP-dependent enzyme [Bryobacteraceae bacterium]|nr:aminotransferase class V-fold PLP-dependent enzyme [Bryobacteraceae bacterium]